MGTFRKQFRNKHPLSDDQTRIIDLYTLQSFHADRGGVALISLTCKENSQGQETQIEVQTPPTGTHDPISGKIEDIDFDCVKDVAEILRLKI